MVRFLRFLLGTALVAASLPLVAPPAAAVIQCWDYNGDAIPDDCGVVFPMAVGIIQTTPGGTPVAGGMPGFSCTATTQPEFASLTCWPPAGTWFCANAEAFAYATSGVVIAKASCTGGPILSAIAVGSGPAVQMDTSGIYYGFPFTCQGDFTGGATGIVECLEPVS